MSNHLSLRIVQYEFLSAKSIIIPDVSLCPSLEEKKNYKLDQGS